MPAESWTARPSDTLELSLKVPKTEAGRKLMNCFGFRRRRFSRARLGYASELLFVALMPQLGLRNLSGRPATQTPLPLPPLPALPSRYFTPPRVSPGCLGVFSAGSGSKIRFAAQDKRPADSVKVRIDGAAAARYELRYRLQTVVKLAFRLDGPGEARPLMGVTSTRKHQSY